jgi:hypothetical protein
MKLVKTEPGFKARLTLILELTLRNQYFLWE